MTTSEFHARRQASCCTVVVVAVPRATGRIEAIVAAAIASTREETRVVAKPITGTERGHEGVVVASDALLQRLVDVAKVAGREAVAPAARAMGSEGRRCEGVGTSVIPRCAVRQGVANKVARGRTFICIVPVVEPRVGRWAVWIHVPILAPRFRAAPVVALESAMLGDSACLEAVSCPLDRYPGVAGRVPSV
jgi:hypothetical protein